MRQSVIDFLDFLDEVHLVASSEERNVEKIKRVENGEAKFEHDDEREELESFGICGKILRFSCYILYQLFRDAELLMNYLTFL